MEHFHDACMVLLHPLYSFSVQLNVIAWKTVSNSTIFSFCVFLVAYLTLKYITLEVKMDC